jgi:hypothetical protein
METVKVKVNQSHNTPMEGCIAPTHSRFRHKMGVSGQRHGRALPPRKGPSGTHWTRGWVFPRAGLDTEATGKNRLLLPGNEPGSPGHPVRSQTL